MGVCVDQSPGYHHSTRTAATTTDYYSSVPTCRYNTEQSPTYDALLALHNHAKRVLTSATDLPDYHSDDDSYIQEDSHVSRDTFCPPWNTHTSVYPSKPARSWCKPSLGYDKRAYCGRYSAGSEGDSDYSDCFAGGEFSGSDSGAELDSCQDSIHDLVDFHLEKTLPDTCNDCSLPNRVLSDYPSSLSTTPLLSSSVDSITPFTPQTLNSSMPLCRRPLVSRCANYGASELSLLRLALMWVCSVWCCRDGRDVGGKKNWRTRKAMQRNAQMNRNTALNQQDFIPRTERAPKDRNIAETEPAKFAAMLIQRLEVVKDDMDKLDKMKDAIKICDSVTTTDEEEVRSQAGPKSMPSVGSLQLNALIASAMAENDDNAQSILDDHFSRVWDGSSGQTPIRSPGRSPDRAHRSRSLLAGPSPNVSAAILRTLAQKSRKEKEPHLISMLSFDSGVGGEDKAGVYGEGDSSHFNRYVHHHHHHHHVKDSKHRQEQGDANARRPLTYYTSDPHLRGGSDPMNTSGVWEERGRSRDAKRSASSAKKCSDTSSNIDSGVSLRFDASPHQVPNLHHPTNEKVLNWMLENEKLHSGPSQDSDKSSSHKRSSHKSGSSMTASGHRSSSKKAAYGGGSRSASLDRSRERGGLMIGDFNQGAPMVPAQPIVQDPSMPLLNPPNPMTQLEEAKRRLEDESKQRIKQSRSFTASSSKDRRGLPPPLGYAAVPPRSLPIASRTIPAAPNTSLNMSCASEDPNMSARSDRSSRQMPPPKKPSASAPNTPAADVTVVGYYFCGEPIPYRTTVPGRSVTLAQFKQLITKRGNYRYFFKKASDEFDSGVILEEVSDDAEVLPLWDGKVVGKVDKIE